MIDRWNFGQMIPTLTPVHSLTPSLWALPTLDPYTTFSSVCSKCHCAAPVGLTVLSFVVHLVAAIEISSSTSIASLLHLRGTPRCL